MEYNLLDVSDPLQVKLLLSWGTDSDGLLTLVAFEETTNTTPNGVWSTAMETHQVSFALIVILVAMASPGTSQGRCAVTHYSDVIMGAMAPQITGVPMVCLTAPRHWPFWGESTGGRWFPSQRASNAENVSIWWRHHALILYVREA